MYRPTYFFCILIFLMTIFSTVVFADTLVVKKDGSSQYRTIQSAVNDSRSGDIILVYGGTYNENISIDGINGSSGDKITIKAADNNNVVLDSGTNKGINFSKSSFWSINGISFTGSGKYALYTYHSSDLTVENCKFEGFSDSAILFHYGSSNGKVSKSFFKNNNYGVQVSDTSKPEIYQNTFSNNNISISLKRTDNGIIYNNYISSPVGNLKWGMYIRDTQNSKIYNNILEGSFVRTFCIYRYTGTSGASEKSIDGHIYNNTLVGSNGGSAFLFDNKSENFLLENNIISDFGTGIYLANGASDFSAKYKNNLFFSNSQNIKSENSSPSDLGGNIDSNPLFYKSGNKPFPYYQSRFESSIQIGANWGSDIGYEDPPKENTPPNTPTEVTING